MKKNGFWGPSRGDGWRYAKWLGIFIWLLWVLFGTRVFVEISGDNTYSTKPYLQSTRQLDRVEYWELRKYTKI
jgi:hypothetical protein